MWYNIYEINFLPLKTYNTLDMYKLLYIYKQAQFSAHIHLSNLINKVIISKQNDMQNCVKMWKLKTAFWVSYLGSTKTVSMENSAMGLT